MPPNSASQTEPSRVLIVDDDANTQGMLTDLLVGEGYEVYVAPRVIDVRACFEAPQPDVVLLDWRLPDGDGLQLLPEIKRRWPTTGVIFMTGYGTSDAALAAAKQGAFRFLNKPFHLTELLDAVRDAQEHKRVEDRAGN